MKTPPPGYDDETVVPLNRFHLLLGELEEGIRKELPSAHLEQTMRMLRIAADEIGEDCVLLVEKLAADFTNQPEALLDDIRELQLLLVSV